MDYRDSGSGATRGAHTRNAGHARNATSLLNMYHPPETISLIKTRQLFVSRP